VGSLALVRFSIWDVDVILCGWGGEILPRK